MKVCVGGTFDIIHEGHIALFERAFETGGEVVVGLSSDNLVKTKKKKTRSYRERKESLEKLFRDMGWKASIEPIDDTYGTAVKEDFDVIVVSPETARNAEEINKMRVHRGLKPLRIVVVPYVLAQDGIPISTSRIKRGEIAGRKRITPLRVCIASGNDVKMAATEDAFNEIFASPHGISITYARTEIKTQHQPAGEKILEGAVRRAAAAVAHGDYGVGIEAGVREEHGTFFAEHYAAVADSVGYITYGKGPAFQCPEWILELMREGKEIKRAVPVPFGTDEERERGLVWYLSKNVERRHLIKEAVVMALLPRMANPHEDKEVTGRKGTPFS